MVCSGTTRSRSGRATENSPRRPPPARAGSITPEPGPVPGRNGIGGMGTGEHESVRGGMWNSFSGVVRTLATTRKFSRSTPLFLQISA
jgi:hypothetical protein